ncbi:S10 family peptidase [Flavobacteriaceae bacterium 14752]|uniref:S10 family peptidase n=1 Tax=Mesohalobacter salilacus TaxID=2491711 RepID=UPI000F640B57|nr:carboxypeptidase [Flavobacteriaceae bacterium 14752]
MRLTQILFSFFTTLCFYSFSIGQDIQLPSNEPVITEHNVNINGKSIDYTAEAGMQIYHNSDGKAKASLFYTYYKRSDVKNIENRPLVFSYNGGPGSASVWMHLAYTGPRVLKISDEGFPVQPYGVKANPNSILDIADIVYINPVNTGYSRPIKDEDGKFNRDEFFGVQADIKYLAEWMNAFVQKHNRWLSPKYLIGESYGTVRVSGLADELQSRQWMYINGVILVSPTELGNFRNGILGIANRLPYFTAAAWYHKQLPSELQQLPLEKALKQSEDFTMNKLVPLLYKGGFKSPQDLNQAAEKMAYFSGIDKDLFLEHNLDLSYNNFWKLLLKDEGFTIGRLDSRYLGIDRQVAGSYPDYNAELTAWLQAFTPAINHYIKNELKFDVPLKYNMFGPVRPWDRRNSRNNTGERLRQAMAQNPSMQVLIQSGYYDGATTYFNAKYTMWHIDPSGRMQDRFHFKAYESGHMMYLRNEDLKQANDDLREFIIQSLPEKGKPIKYNRK